MRQARGRCEPDLEDEHVRLAVGQLEGTLVEVEGHAEREGGGGSVVEGDGGGDEGDGDGGGGDGDEGGGGGDGDEGGGGGDGDDDGDGGEGGGEGDVGDDDGDGGGDDGDGERMHNKMLCAARDIAVLRCKSDVAVWPRS